MFAGVGALALVQGLRLWHGWVDAPVGADVGLWVGSALDWREGTLPVVAPVGPALAATLASALGVGVVEVWRGLAAAAGALLPAAVALGARAAGASVRGALVAAGLLLVLPDVLAHGWLVGPDALSALTSLGFAALLLGDLDDRRRVLALAAVGCFAAGLREPLAVGVALSGLWLLLRERRGVGGVLLGAPFLGPLWVWRWPTGLADAIPVLGRAEPALRDVPEVEGVPGHLLEASATLSGAFPATAAAVRGSARDALAAGPQPLLHLGFDLLHGVLHSGDLYLLVVLGFLGLRRHAVGARVLPFAAPLLLGALLWTERRHPFLWVAPAALGLALSFDSGGWARRRVLALGVALLLAAPASLAANRAWIRGQEAAEGQLAHLGRQIRAASEPDDLLAFGTGFRDTGVALMVTSERARLAKGARLSGPAQWRAVIVGADSPGEGFAVVAEANGLRAWRYRPEVTGADRVCQRGVLRTPIRFVRHPGAPELGALVGPLASAECRRIPERDGG